MNIAIIGLGRVGRGFLTKMEEYEKNGVKIVAVAEPENTEGKAIALSKGIPVKTSEEIVLIGESLDIIFDFTGKAKVRGELRKAMQESNNHHTVIAPETFAFLLWSIMEDQPLPDVHSHKGY